MFRPLCMLVCLVGLCACHVSARPAPVYGTAEVSGAPIRVDFRLYPHTIYGGRWYFRDGGTWRFYRQEPMPLLQFRQRGYIQQAPPAPNENTPPPAVRVR